MTNWTNQTKHTSTYTEQPISFGFLLLENGSFCLLENGGRIILNKVTDADWSSQTKH